MLASAAFVGCGGDDSESTTTEPAASGTTSTETAPAAGGGDTVAIAMKGIQFVPAEQTVKVGQKIVWTNEDEAQHDADSTSGDEFNTELVGKGGTVEYTPEAAGTIKYVCSVHPTMVGTLTVE